MDTGDEFAVESRVRGDRFGDCGDGGTHPREAVEGHPVAAATFRVTFALHPASQAAIVAASRIRACGGLRGRVQGRADMMFLGKVAEY